MRIPLDWLQEYVDLNGFSPKEVGDAFTQLGLMIDKPFDGKVFDLEHRFDRSDWLSILGCARDLAAYLKLDLKLPQTYAKEGKKPSNDQLIDIKVECPDAVNRFNTRVFRNVKVKPSPDWLKNRLEEYGVPSINNIVDITNYVMVELGQTLHAQDLATFRKQEIVIRKAHNDEKLFTLSGEEVTLYPEAFVLTQEGVATVLGGIVGGKETAVTEKTTNLVLDSGNYNQDIIRKVSRKIKIQNESVLRNDKFLHPDLTQYAIERATYLILQLAGGEYYQNIDWYPKIPSPKIMTLRSSRVMQLAGFEIQNETILDILTRLGYQIQTQNKENFKLVVPYFRTDLEVEDDVVSDILRINGYSKIPTAQIQSAPPKDITPKIYNFEETLRDALLCLGGHEYITDSLVSLNGNLAGNQIRLENSQNSNKDALRTTISETLREIIPNYMKNQLKSGVLFEIGKVYAKDGRDGIYENYHETRVLECLLFDSEKNPKELHVKTSSLLSTLMDNIGVSNYSLKKVEKLPVAKILVNDRVLGSISHNGFTLYTEDLLVEQTLNRRILSDIRSFNTLKTSFIIPKEFPVSSLLDVIKSSSSDITKVEFVEEYIGKELGIGKRSVLIRTHFKPEIPSTHTAKMIESIVHKMKGIADITIRN